MEMQMNSTQILYMCKLNTQCDDNHNTHRNANLNSTLKSFNLKMQAFVNVMAFETLRFHMIFKDSKIVVVDIKRYCDCNHNTHGD